MLYRFSISLDCALGSVSFLQRYTWNKEKQIDTMENKIPRKLLATSQRAPDVG